MTINELRPYYIRAHDVLGLGEFSYIPENIGSALGFKTFPFDRNDTRNDGFPI